MPLRQPRRAGLLLKTGQTTQYSGEFDDGYYEKGLAKSYTVLTTGAYSGNTNIDLAHLVSATAAFTGATHTIADVGKCGVFKAAGGETVVISGAADPANNGTFTTASATANALVLTAGLADEAAGATVTIAKREAHANACVLDNNTGLMWSRTASASMGTGGDGAMPWTGAVYDIFAYCAAANTGTGLAGYTDWRVPEANALLSLVDYEAASSVPDATAFPGFAAGTSYSSSTMPEAVANAVTVELSSSGISRNRVKTASYSVILVRGG